MQLTSDWHIHSMSSCDSASLRQEDLVADAAALGIVDFGVTDHLHTPFNLGDIRESRRIFDAVCASPRYHFGVEVSCVSQWELDEVASGRHANPVCGVRSGGPPDSPLAIGLTAADIEEFGIEFVVAGTHWPMYCPIERESVIRDYHRQNMFLASHPLVTIVAHPWWWAGAWQDADGIYRGDPWPGDFRRIPQSMHDEFAAAAREHGKVVEANLCAMVLSPQLEDRFIRQYLDYLAWLHSENVPLSLGSDCHDRRYTDVNFERAGILLESVGLADEVFWRLPERENLRDARAEEEANDRS